MDYVLTTKTLLKKKKTKLLGIFEADICWWRFLSPQTPAYFSRDINWRSLRAFRWTYYTVVTEKIGTLEGTVIILFYVKKNSLFEEMYLPDS
jgi:hypothetical protein